MKTDKISNYPDLVKYRIKGIILPLIFTGIFEILLIIGIVILCIADMFINHFVFYLIIVCVAFIPIVMLKPFSFINDKNYVGKVEKIEYKELISEDRQIPVGHINGIGNLQDERSNEHIDCWQKIIINTDDNKKVIYDAKLDVGKTHQDEGIPVGSFEAKKYVVSSLLDYYKVGDEVEHFSGFYYNKKLNLNPNEKNICIVCGALNIPKDDVCANCGHSIVK